MKPLQAQGRSVCTRWLIASVCAFALAASAAAQTLTITAPDGHSSMLSAAQIAAAAHVAITADEHGTPAKFEGVPLASVLTMAGIQLGARCVDRASLKSSLSAPPTATK